MKILKGVLAGIFFIPLLAGAQSTDSLPDQSTEAVVYVAHKVAGVETWVKRNTPLSGQERDQNQDQGDPVRSRTVSKTFPVDNSDKLMLSNQYGSIEIKTWERKEIKVDVDIKAYAKNESDAQELLDQVTIESGKTSDGVLFRTKMDQDRNMGSGSRNGRKWRREVRVNYVVYMPSVNAVNLSQTYGSIVMPDMGGAVYAKVQYGNFTAENLRNSNNYISVQYGNTNIQRVNSAVVKQQYGSGCTIGAIGTLNLDAEYSAVTINTIRGDGTIKQQYGSGLSVGSVENLNLDIQYASVNVGAIRGNATIRQQYNSLAIGTVGRLNLKAEYCNTSVGVLRGDANFDMEYNNLNIKEVTTACKALNIDGDYVGMSIFFNDAFNADVSVHTSYAPFKFGNEVSVRQTGDTDDSSTKDYIGNGGTARVKITADYGSVTFK
jgi:hypothetical protein